MAVLIARIRVPHNNLEAWVSQVAPSIDRTDNRVTAAAAAPPIQHVQADEPMPADGAQALKASSPSAPLGLASASSVVAPIRSVNPGDRVNIPCSLANSGGSIQFAKDDQAIVLDSGCAQCQLDISNDGQASLTINRVSHKDQGNWQCWSLDSAGKVRHKLPIIQLIVTNSPELPILVVNDRELLSGNNPDTITVKENEIVSFRCLIRGASTPVDYIHWMLDSSQNITHLSQMLIDYPGDNQQNSNNQNNQNNNYLVQSVLKLNTTKSMNLKSISCLSNHQLWLTPMTVTAFLNVLYEPSFTISREPGFGVAVSEGMTVILKCEIDSNPISAPIWVKDADNKTASSSGQSSSVQQPSNQAEPIVLDTQEDGSVILGRTKQSDSGWYRCKTENRYGNFSSFGYYLYVRPAISSASPALGSTGVDNSNSGALTPAPMSRQNNQHQNNLHAPNQHNAARLMGPNQSPRNINNHNNANSNSNMMINNMINNDQPIQSPYSNVQPAAQLSSQNPNLAMEQARCRSAKVEGAPEIDKPVSIAQAILGRQLILSVRFCCNPKPTRIFWIHRHLAMIPGRMFGPYITREVYNTYNSASCYETTFEIEYVKPEDLGTVYVYITNERGLSAAQINIQLSRLGQYDNFANSLGPNSQFRLGSGGGVGGSQMMGASSGAAGGRTTTNQHGHLALMILLLAILQQSLISFGGLRSGGLELTGTIMTTALMFISSGRRIINSARPTLAR